MTSITNSLNCRICTKLYVATKRIITPCLGALLLTPAIFADVAKKEGDEIQVKTKGGLEIKFEKTHLHGNHM